MNWLKSKLSNGIWSGLAAIIVLLMAGPEIAISIELFALVEVLGPSTFVLAYIAGFKLYLYKPYSLLKRFEKHSCFFVPSLACLKKMPSLIIHAVPERVATLAFCSILMLGPLVVATPVFAENWYKDGKPAESTSFQGASGDFGAMILMTTDSQKALENWSMPSPGVHILEAETVEKGKPIEALVLFSGCTANKKDHCVAEVDYQVVKPDGSIYAEYKNTELWRNKPALPVGRLGLAVDRVGLITEPSDPVGKYKIRCIVRDLVSGAEFSIYSSFDVVEAN